MLRFSIDATVDRRNPSRTDFKPCLKPRFIGIYRGIINPEFLKWCRTSSIHSIKMACSCCEASGCNVIICFQRLEVQHDIRRPAASAQTRFEGARRKDCSWLRAGINSLLRPEWVELASFRPMALFGGLRCHFHDVSVRMHTSHVFPVCIFAGS